MVLLQALPYLHPLHALANQNIMLLVHHIGM